MLGTIGQVFWESVERRGIEIERWGGEGVQEVLVGEDDDADMEFEDAGMDDDADEEDFYKMKFVTVAPLYECAS